MRVIVLGSGVIGVASAYYLAQQGAQVTVLDGFVAQRFERQSYPK